MQGYTVGFIVGAILYLIVNGILASKASDAADDKGYDKRTWFHMCFWLGPVAYLVVAALPDFAARQQRKEILDLLKQQAQQAIDQAQHATYQKGLDYLLAKQYDQAAEVFKSLKDYKDSAEKAKRAIYEKGTDLLMAKQYDQASLVFKSLWLYQDSAEKAQEAIYQKAADLLTAKHYSQAIELLTTLGAYKDVAELAEQAQQTMYQKAKDLLLAKQYDQAEEAFISLGSYLDSMEMVKESAYQKGKAQAEAGR